MHSSKQGRKLFVGTVIAASGAAVVAIVGSATAQAQPAAVPAPAPAPAVPGLPFLQQLASNPAAATQLLQTVAGIVDSTPATATAASAPVAPPAAPGATASITLPQPAAALPGAATPAATTPAATPSVSPLSGLTDVLGAPGSLASLLPTGNPLGALLPSAASAAPVAAAPAAAAPAPAVSVVPMMGALSALP